VDASYAYNYNHFNEIPSTADYGISNQVPQYLPAPGATVNTGLVHTSLRRTTPIASQSTPQRLRIFGGSTPFPPGMHMIIRTSLTSHLGQARSSASLLRTIWERIFGLCIQISLLRLQDLSRMQVLRSLLRTRQIWPIRLAQCAQ